MRSLGLFQSSPSPKARCNLSRLTRLADRIKRSSNPHPARRPGATLTTEIICWQGKGCSNPHPARRPGATPQRRENKLKELKFQSSPSPKARCNTNNFVFHQVVKTVPILTQPEGQVQPMSKLTELEATMFQSSPSPKARCNLLTIVPAIK